MCLLHIPVAERTATQFSRRRNTEIPLSRFVPDALLRVFSRPNAIAYYVVRRVIKRRGRIVARNCKSPAAVRTYFTYVHPCSLSLSPVIATVLLAGRLRTARSTRRNFVLAHTATACRFPREICAYVRTQPATPFVCPDAHPVVPPSTFALSDWERRAERNVMTLYEVDSTIDAGPEIER